MTNLEAESNQNEFGLSGALVDTCRVVESGKTLVRIGTYDQYRPAMHVDLCHEAAVNVVLGLRPAHYTPPPAVFSQAPQQALASSRTRRI